MPRLSPQAVTSSRAPASSVNVRLVSFPSWELFANQEVAYRDQVLPPKIRSRIAVEAGVTFGWERWVGEHGKIMGLDHFGASAPYETLYEKFGLTPAKVVEAAGHLLREQQVDELSQLGRYSWMQGEEN